MVWIGTNWFVWIISETKILFLRLISQIDYAIDSFHSCYKQFCLVKRIKPLLYDSWKKWCCNGSQPHVWISLVIEQAPCQFDTRDSIEDAAAILQLHKIIILWLNLFYILYSSLIYYLRIICKLAFCRS